MSWFSRRRKNRQHVRRHVLDVKLSTSQQRSTRLRWLGVTLGTAALAIGVSLGAWRGGEWALQRLLYQNPAFAIHELEAETDGVIAAEQIRRWTGVRLEDNLFAIDLARVKRDLEFVPVVRSAEVERVLPHTLRVRIVEREPVAQFIFAQPRLGGPPEQVAYTLDEEGFVIPHISTYQRAVPSPTNDTLPILSGFPPNEIRPGRRIESPQVLAALKLITAFERSPMAGLVDLREIQVGSADVLQVQTEQRGMILFGLKNVDQQLQRWRSIYDFGRRRGMHVATLDLSVANNVPARWLEASEAALVKPKSSRPLRLRKRNV